MLEPRMNARHGEREPQMNADERGFNDITASRTIGDLPVSAFICPKGRALRGVHLRLHCRAGRP
jgi:hypothetical protein